jgi:hypothetical protein
MKVLLLALLSGVAWADASVAAGTAGWAEPGRPRAAGEVRLRVGGHSVVVARRRYRLPASTGTVEVVACALSIVDADGIELAARRLEPALVLDTSIRWQWRRPYQDLAAAQVLDDATRAHTSCDVAEKRLRAVAR